MLPYGFGNPPTSSFPQFASPYAVPVFQPMYPAYGFSPMQSFPVAIPQPFYGAQPYMQLPQQSFIPSFIPQFQPAPQQQSWFPNAQPFMPQFQPAPQPQAPVPPNWMPNNQPFASAPQQQTIYPPSMPQSFAGASQGQAPSYGSPQVESSVPGGPLQYSQSPSHTNIGFTPVIVQNQSNSAALRSGGINATMSAGANLNIDGMNVA